jgi:GAF domain-containing protein
LDADHPTSTVTPINSVVAYLGVPLEDPEGHVLGALCIIDRGPRQWDAKSVELLQDLSRIAMDVIVLETARLCRLPGGCVCGGSWTPRFTSPAFRRRDSLP